MVPDIGPGRNLIVARRVDIEIALDDRIRLRIEIVFVVPVAHNDRLGRPFEEIFVIPRVIGPDPRPRAVLFALLDEEQEILLPELALTNHDIFERRLMPVRLFVVAQVEEPRPVEDLDDFLNELRADFIVRRRRDHLCVVAEPEVVARREVQFRNRLQTHLAQPLELFPKFIDRPRAFNRDLRMRFILDAFSQVDYDHIEPELRRLVRELVPKVLLERKVIDRRSIRRRAVAPHIMAQMEQNAPDQLARLGGLRRKQARLRKRRKNRRRRKRRSRARLHKRSSGK